MTKFLFALVVSSISSFSQKPLSQEAINDFASIAYYKYRYEQNNNFRSFINTYLIVYSRTQIAMVMENLKTDQKGREEVFKLIKRVSGNKDNIFNSLYSMGLKAINANEIATYIYQKYNPQESTVKEKPKAIIWQPPGKGFFEGTRTFCDSLDYWYYKMTIIENTVLLVQYPARNNMRAEKDYPFYKTIKRINGDHIVSERNYPSNYKYENNILYEKKDTDEGEREEWTKYTECKK